MNKMIHNDSSEARRYYGLERIPSQWGTVLYIRIIRSMEVLEKYCTGIIPSLELEGLVKIYLSHTFYGGCYDW